MEKSLLSILRSEEELIREIVRLEDKVKQTSEWRIFLLMNTPDCDSKVQEIKRLQSEIDDLNNQKFDRKKELEEVRRSIASYLKYLNN